MRFLKFAFCVFRHSLKVGLRPFYSFNKTTRGPAFVGRAGHFMPFVSSLPSQIFANRIARRRYQPRGLAPRRGRLTSASRLASREATPALRRAFRTHVLFELRKQEASNSGYDTVSNYKGVTGV
jgi:hypothetical protein